MKRVPSQISDVYDFEEPDDRMRISDFANMNAPLENYDDH